MLRNSIIICLILTLTSCGAPTTVIRSGSNSEIDKERRYMQQIAFKAYHERLEKLNNLAYPLLKSSTTFCENNLDYTIGMRTISINQINKKFRESLASGNQVYSFGQFQKIIYVIKDSPADKAGLKKGHLIHSIKKSPDDIWIKDDIYKNNEKNHYSENSVLIKLYWDGTSNLNEFKEFKEKYNPPGPGSTDPNRYFFKEIKVLPEKICGYGVKLIQNDSLNAYADGKNIYITQGMMRFVEEDRELQFIIGHELAHNMEGHIEKKTNNSILGTILDIAAGSAGVNTEGLFGSIGAQMYSQDFEKEADYVGMYILSRAEIDSSNIENFWRKLAIESPGSTINYNSTHPTSPERWATIKEPREEIYSKILNNLPLIPERKE